MGLEWREDGENVTGFLFLQERKIERNEGNEKKERERERVVGRQSFLFFF